MAIVFVDVFFIYNFIINLILLITTKLVSFLKVRSINLVLGAFVGSFYAVCVMIFGIDGLLSYALNTIALCAVVFISFMPKSIKSFLKCSAVFFAANFLYGGAMFFLIYFFRTGMHFGGGVFYIDIPVLPLILAAAAVYALVCFTKHVLQKRLLLKDRIHTLEITIGKEAVIVDALYDTGNSLFEPISGAPVIFVEESAFLGKDIKITTYRAIPYKSAGGSGILMAFSPDSIKIDNKKTEISVYVAFYSGILSKDGEYRAVLHPFAMPHSSPNKEVCSVDI